MTGLVLPPNGVYAVHARLRGREHRGALNLGLRPTLASPTPRLQCEVHLLDFAEEIYGTELELTFAAKLRNEQKFPDVMALQSQITGDLAAVQAPQCETAGVSAPAVCCSAWLGGVLMCKLYHPCPQLLNRALKRASRESATRPSVTVGKSIG